MTNINPNTARRVSRLFGTAVCVLVLALAAGCGGGGKEPKNQVTGKVTLDGKPVNGSVIFVAADNKEYQSPIGMTDGTYQIIDAPNGNMKVYIKGNLAAAGGKLVEPKAGGPEMPKAGIGGGSAVEAPAKYNSAATSGLTFEVKGGKQEYNIALTP